MSMLLYFFFRPSSVFKTNTLDEATLPYKYCTSSTYTEKIYIRLKKHKLCFCCYILFDSELYAACGSN